MCDVVGSIVGLFVGDAASVNSHWCYPQLFPDAYAKFVAEHSEAPEFVEPIFNPFYRGQPSPYAENVFALLQSLVESEGVDVVNYKKKLYGRIGPNTRYDSPPPAENAIVGKPVQGGHKNHAMIDFVNNYPKLGPEGNLSRKDDPQIDGAVLAILLTVVYAGHPKLTEYVTDIVRATQDDEAAINTAVAMAKFLEKIFLTKTFNTEIVTNILSGKEKIDFPEDVSKHFPDILNSLHLTHKEFNEANDFVWINCRAPNGFYFSLHVLLKELKNSNVPSEFFVKAIRAVILEGGCNSSRADLFGAIAGGIGGVSAIPKSWIAKTEHYDEIHGLAKQLAALKPKLLEK